MYPNLIMINEIFNQQYLQVCDQIENSDRTGTGPDWGHIGWNRTGLQPENFYRIQPD